jgi:hypothetical protein
VSTPPPDRPDRPRFGEYSDQRPNYGTQAPLGHDVPEQRPVPQAPPPISHRSHNLGAIAAIVGLVVFVAAPVVMAFIGVGFAPTFSELSKSGAALDPNSLTAAEMSQVSGWSYGFLAVLLAGTVLGLWALVQGIVAISRNRGRGFGILAIVFAVLAPFASIIAFSAAAASALPPGTFITST